MTFASNPKYLDASNMSADISGDPIDITTVTGYSLQAAWTQYGSSAVAKTFADTDVDTTSNEITITGHGFLDSQEVRLSTADTLPAPLAVLTDYYVIKIDANTIKLATSAANAAAGTAIDITDQGTALATFTATPRALAGAVKIQASSDAYLPDSRLNSDAHWADISGSSVSVSGSGSNLYNVVGAYYRWIRLVWTRTSGNGVVSAQYHGKNL